MQLIEPCLICEEPEDVSREGWRRRSSNKICLLVITEHGAAFDDALLVMSLAEAGGEIAK